MNANQAHSLLSQGVEFLEVLVDRMSSPAVRENDHGGGSLEDSRVFRPSSLVYGRFDGEARFLDQGIGQQVHAVSPVMGA